MKSLNPRFWKSLLRSLNKRWSDLSLAGQFTIAALAVLGCGMTFFGAWVSDRIEKGVVQNTAAGAALYINSFVEPHLRELSRQPNLSSSSIEMLDRLLKDAPLRLKVLEIKIWLPDGSITYSSRRELIGRRYPISRALKRAFNGEVVGEYDDLEDDENELERKLGVPLFEIYSPIRALASGRVIAVAEFYEDASNFHKDLRWARLQSWYAVALVTLLMLSILFSIVRKGSWTIQSQQQALRARIGELSRLLRQNEELRRRIDDSVRSSVETNDLMLRRVGSELHDGPAQLISLALLRLDALRPSPAGRASLEDFGRIHSALSDSLAEIRNISAGLALPELGVVSPADAIRIAVRNHEKRTGTEVKCSVDELPELPIGVKAGLYRVTQEGLNNAFRHAGGAGQMVSASQCNGTIQLEIADSGLGFDVESVLLGTRGLGLKGMRDRVATLGGHVDIQSAAGQGTRLTARFEIANHSGGLIAGTDR